MTGRILSEWKGDDGREYRLRAVRGEAVIDRRLSERGPWRPMPYPRALSNRIAELTAGRQWREVPMPKEESMNDKITTAKTKSGDIAVYLEHRRVGTIGAMLGGYAYVPAGQPRSQHGEIFSTPAEVLESLSWVP